VGADWDPVGGGGASRLLECGSEKVDSLGWRGFWSRGCRAAIISHSHGFLTVRGGVSKSVTVGVLGVAVSVYRFLDLESF